MGRLSYNKWVPLYIVEYNPLERLGCTDERSTHVRHVRRRLNPWSHIHNFINLLALRHLVDSNFRVLNGLRHDILPAPQEVEQLERARVDPGAALTGMEHSVLFDEPHANTILRECQGEYETCRARAGLLWELAKKGVKELKTNDEDRWSCVRGHGDSSEICEVL